MEAGIVLLTLAMVTGQLSSYTTAVLGRGRGGVAVLNNQGLVRSLIGFVGMIATFAVIVWGFFNVTWWWVILLFLAISILVIPATFRRGSGRIPLMIAIQPILDIACISITAYLWFS